MNEAPRNFIEENIGQLEFVTKEVKRLWSKFQNGELTKEQFESKYKSTLDQLKDTLAGEIANPNNACNYYDAAVQNNYFKTMKY